MQHNYTVILRQMAGYREFDVNQKVNSRKQQLALRYLQKCERAETPFIQTSGWQNNWEFFNNHTLFEKHFGKRPNLVSKINRRENAAGSHTSCKESPRKQGTLRGLMINRSLPGKTLPHPQMGIESTTHGKVHVSPSITKNNKVNK